MRSIYNTSDSHLQGDIVYCFYHSGAHNYLRHIITESDPVYVYHLGTRACVCVRACVRSCALVRDVSELRYKGFSNWLISNQAVITLACQIDVSIIKRVIGITHHPSARAGNQ